jgi:hypothetical protein
LVLLQQRQVMADPIGTDAAATADAVQSAGSGLLLNALQAAQHQAQQGIWVMSLLPGPACKG